MESELNDTMSFLDIQMTRRSDGTISRAIYRKNTWAGQYMHFDSFVPIEYKRGLVRTLFDRARRICTNDNLAFEFQTLNETLAMNGYPDVFVSRHSRLGDSKETITSVSRLRVTICVPFKGDDVGQLLKRRLRSAIARVYYAADPVIVYRTAQIPTPPVKERLSSYAKSNVIYEFHCGCGATYVGRTERRLCNRVREHIPNWVRDKVMQSNSTQPLGDNGRAYKTPSSSIARHLLVTRPQVDQGTAFKVVYTTQNSRLLKYAEAIAIRRWKPPLCQQKQIYVTLCLPW